jgi:Flp pilus assembly protein TadD
VIARRVAGLAALALAAACASTAPPEAREREAYANFLVGQVANRRDDHQAASDRYYDALSRRPEDAALAEGALSAALATGDAERARAIARRAREQSGAARMVRAADALAARRLAEADREIARVDADPASDLAAGMMLAWVRTAEGRVDDVLIELAPLANVRPYGGLFAYQQAMALDYAGRKEEALEAFAIADRTQLWMPAGVERHADLLARMGRRAEAATVLLATEARASNPVLARALGRLQAGETPALSPLTPAQGAAIGLHGLAGIFLEERDTTSGLTTLTLALMLDPAQDAARLTFADAQSNLGHSDAARRALAAIQPNSVYAANARVLDAWVLFREGRREEAVARAREEQGPRGRRALADMYRNLQRWDEAEPIYNALIGENGRDWRLYFARAAARDKMGRWGEAEADLRRALELSPNQPEVANYLGYALIERGERADEALMLIRSAAEQRPLSGAIIDSLGWAYFHQGDYAQAIVYLERAVELEPASVVINDHLGDAYWRTDRRIEARFQWQRALTLAPDAGERTMLTAKLEDGLPSEPPTRSATR